MKKSLATGAILFVLALPAHGMGEDGFFVIPVVKKMNGTGGVLHLIDGNGAERGLFMDIEDNIDGGNIFDPVSGLFYKIENAWTGETGAKVSNEPTYYESVDCTGQSYYMHVAPWVSFSFYDHPTVYKCIAVGTRNLQSMKHYSGCEPNIYSEVSVCTAWSPVSIPASLPTPLRLELR